MRQLYLTVNYLKDIYLKFCVFPHLIVIIGLLLIFSYYLFDVLESGYSLVNCILGRKHYTFPFTDCNNKVIGVIDVCCLNFLNKHKLVYLHKSLIHFQEGYEQLVIYTGVDTYGQYNNADEYNIISKNQEETEINSQIEEVKSDWIDENNKFIPKIIVKKLAKMELSLLTLKIDKDVSLLNHKLLMTMMN